MCYKFTHRIITFGVILYDKLCVHFILLEVVKHIINNISFNQNSPIHSYSYICCKDEGTIVPCKDVYSICRAILIKAYIVDYVLAS